MDNSRVDFDLDTYDSTMKDDFVYGSESEDYLCELEDEANLFDLIDVHNNSRRLVNDEYESVEELNDDDSPISAVDPAIIPREGLSFSNLKECEMFYENYATELGFNIRRSSTKYCLDRKNKVKNLSFKKYVCWKEGQYVQKAKKRKISSSLSVVDAEANLDGIDSEGRRCGISRCGCKAKLCVKLNQISKQWDVVSFVEDHNHKLVSPSKKKYLRPNRRITKATKNLLASMSQVNIPTAKQITFLDKQSGSDVRIGSIARDIYNLKRDQKKEIEGHDAVMLLEHLEYCKSITPEFFYVYKKDDDLCLTHCMWIDAYSMEDYKLFGDAVTFDTTYNTNKYKLIFASLCGVNNHKQTVFFCNAFLMNETKESFVWLFKNFLLAVNVAPKTIITDQCPSINAAIREVFPYTKHRYCGWHITANMKKRIGLTKKADIAIPALNKIIWGAKSEQDFEVEWDRIVTECNLEKNRWINVMYRIRRKWVPIYMRSYFFAEMRTTQRSESMNSFLTNHVNQMNSLYEFMTRFQTAVERLREHANWLDNENENKNPKLATQWSIEKQFSEHFTKTVFYIVKTELSEGIELNVIPFPSVDDVIQFRVYPIGRIEDFNRVSFHACYNKFKCDCMKMESMGIPCRHIISVLKHTDALDVQSSLLLNRWKKDIKRNGYYPLYRRRTVQDDNSQLRVLANELISEADGNKEVYDYIKKVLIDASEEAKAIKSKRIMVNAEDVNDVNDKCDKTVFVVKDPNVAKPKGSGKGGRPKGSTNRLKSTSEENSSKGRQCKLCHKFNAGHDSRNCPSKS